VLASAEPDDLLIALGFSTRTILAQPGSAWYYAAAQGLRSGMNARADNSIAMSVFPIAPRRGLGLADVAA